MQRSHDLGSYSEVASRRMGGFVLTGNSEVIHFDEKRAFRRSDQFGVPIRAATRDSSRMVGNPEVIP